jgi:hypothetical protein
VHLTAAVAVAVAAQAADLAVKIIIFGFFYYSSRPAQSRAPLSTKKMVRRVVEQKPRSGLLTISWALLVTDEEWWYCWKEGMVVAPAVPRVC